MPLILRLRVVLWAVTGFEPSVVRHRIPVANSAVPLDVVAQAPVTVAGIVG